MLFVYVIPYELIVSQLGLTFDQQAGGLASWIRRGTGNDLFGYATSWMYWVQTIPYLVDVSNSIIVSFSWIILGDATLSSHMSTFTFGLLTFVIILAFILLENIFKKRLRDPILDRWGRNVYHVDALCFNDRLCFNTWSTYCNPTL